MHGMENLNTSKETNDHFHYIHIMREKNINFTTCLLYGAEIIRN